MQNGFGLQLLKFVVQEMEETIVKEWLCSLSLGHYTESFMDNGYDDLEICKQIDAPDLDAIGVVDFEERSRLLGAVHTLRVEGAASVYFTVEEAQAARLDSTSPNYFGIGEKEENIIPCGGTTSLSKHADYGNIIRRLCNLDHDVYELGKAELVRLPQLQLRQLLENILLEDKVDLTIHPYTLEEGQRGVLEGLASRYADIFKTHYQDVLEHLEYLRCYKWNLRLTQLAKTATLPAHGCPLLLGFSSGNQVTDYLSPISSSSLSSHDREDPIYLPGKYNPSSCLSDAEENQIYGLADPGALRVISESQPGCLTQRSQHIFELPPMKGDTCQHAAKRRLGIGRLLKTLRKDLKKVSDPKNRTGFTNKKNSLDKNFDGSDLSNTPLVILPGCSSPTSSCSHSSNHSYVINSFSAPGTPVSASSVKDSGLQEAIEKLKREEIRKRREEQFREHTQVLQDLRYGLAQTQLIKLPQSTSYKKIPKNSDSGYANAESSMKGDRSGDRDELKIAYFQHWYDEPPYESDPEDFLIGKESSRKPKAREPNASEREDVISLKTAGDIALSREIRTNVPLQEGRSSIKRSTYPKILTNNHYIDCPVEPDLNYKVIDNPTSVPFQIENLSINDKGPFQQIGF